MHESFCAVQKTICELNFNNIICATECNDNITQKSIKTHSEQQTT